MDVIAKCKPYSDLGAVIAAETAAEIWGWTSADIRIQYIGDKDLEETYDDLHCVREMLYSDDVVVNLYGVNILDVGSTLVSLLVYGASSYGLEAIKTLLGYCDQSIWRKMVEEKGIFDDLKEALDTAYGLGMIDSIQHRDWTASKQWEHYDMSKFNIESEG